MGAALPADRLHSRNARLKIYHCVLVTRRNDIASNESAAPHMKFDYRLPNWSSGLLAEFDAADLGAESVAKELSAVQLNWQPRQGAWSVGQCLEHLRAANEIYLPAISAALEGRHPARIDEVRLGWFTRWFIR